MTSRDEQVVALARTALRLVGPRFTALDDAMQDASVASRYCRRCDPEPEVFTCGACDFATEANWVFLLHLKLSPQWCRDRAAKKAKAWGNKT